ncbi:MAG: hypothetical protein IJ316_04270, partial [Clostridia bacterium]|nr:hypothetical protein [Clostridia bacterium]
PIAPEVPVQPVIEQPIAPEVPVQPVFAQSNVANQQFAGAQKVPEAYTAPIPPVTPVAPVAEVEGKKKKGKKGLLIGGIVIGVVAVVAAIVGLVMFLLGNGGGAEPVFYVKDNTRMMVLAGKTKPIEVTKAETTISATNDGKYIVYGVDYDKDDETYTLVYASVNKPDDYTEIDKDVTGFGVAPGGNGLVYYKDDSLYISTSLEEGKKVLEGEDGVYMQGITQDLGKILYMDNGTLYIKDIAEDEEEKIANNVYSVEYRYTDEDNHYIDLSELYYVTESDTLYKWTDGDATKIASDVYDLLVTKDCVFYSVEDYYDYDVYMLDENGEEELIINDADYGYCSGQYVEVGSEYHVFTTKGDVIIFDEYEVSEIEISEDNQYLYAVKYSNGTLYSYKIDEGELTDETELCDDVDYIYANNDNTIYARSNDYENEGIAYGSKYYETAKNEEYGHYEITGGKIYYVTDGDLYIATLGEEADKADCEDDVKYVYVAGEHVYYIANWDDKKEEGDLYLLGKDKVVDEGVSGFGSYVEEDEEYATEMVYYEDATEVWDYDYDYDYAYEPTESYTYDAYYDYYDEDFNF